MKFSLGAYKYYILALFTLAFLTVGLIGLSKSKQFLWTRVSQEKSSIHEDSTHSNGKEIEREELGRELYPMGSSLPDCSHACGVCSPCKRVMVSFKCASESCPIVYRCMCKGKFYHVPSSK